MMHLRESQSGGRRVAVQEDTLVVQVDTKPLEKIIAGVGFQRLDKKDDSALRYSVRS